MTDENFQFVAAQLATNLIRHGTPTDFFNEGNLLSLVLAEGEQCPGVLPFSVDPSWFCQPRLYSPFLPRWRGDPDAEGFTRPDAIMGDFEFRTRTRTGVRLLADGSAFNVIEAKLRSVLSRGITNREEYDQATRTVACIAYAAVEAGWHQRPERKCGYYVFAPESAIAKNVFTEFLDKQHIKVSIAERIAQYAPDLHDEYQEIAATWFTIIDHMDIRTEPWEPIIDAFSKRQKEAIALADFFRSCCRHNGIR
jgi:hypothetical protein